MLPAAAKKSTYIDQKLALHVGEYEQSIIIMSMGTTIIPSQ